MELIPRKQFYKIPDFVLLNCNDSEIYSLLLLIIELKQFKTCNNSLDTFVEKYGQDRKFFSRAFNKLKKLGFIIIKTTRQKGGVKENNIYSLNYNEFEDYTAIHKKIINRMDFNKITKIKENNKENNKINKENEIISNIKKEINEMRNNNKDLKNSKIKKKNEYIKENNKMIKEKLELIEENKIKEESVLDYKALVFYIKLKRWVNNDTFIAYNITKAEIDEFQPCARDTTVKYLKILEDLNLIKIEEIRFNLITLTMIEEIKIKKEDQEIKEHNERYKVLEAEFNGGKYGI